MLDMADSGLDNSCAVSTVDDHFNDDITSISSDDKSWQYFKATKSTNANDNEDYFKMMLKNPRRSILGDTWICTKGDDKYYLDRAIMASKSNYLARFVEVNNDLDIENMIVNTIHDNSVLASILQIMYGKDLKSLICERNFVDLLKNMCYLEMETDLDVFKQFINENIEPKEEVCHEMVKLYFFMLRSRLFEECNCDYLLPTVSQYFSGRLLKAYKIQEFLSVPYEGLFRILLHRSKDEFQDKGLIGRICAAWICHDFENRVVKLIKLVNAAKHRYGIFLYCDADEEESVIDYLKQIHDNRLAEVEKCFNEMLFYHGHITFDASQLADEISNESQMRIINMIDQPSRWAMFLEKGYFCDVIIDVQGFPFKLHRIKLLSSSQFFYDLFTKNSNSLNSITNEKSEKLISETYTLDEIDAAAFKKIIRYIYNGEIEITSEYLMINLLKASKFLLIDDLYEACYVWFLNSLCKITNVFDLFQFLRENDWNSDLYVLVVHRILDMWPEFDDNAYKYISLEALKSIVALPALEMDTPDEVVVLCSKWIFHNMEKRYCHMYEIAIAINRNFSAKIKQLKLEVPDPENLVEYSVKGVEELLTKFLCSTTLVPLNYDGSLKNEYNPRFTGIRKDGALSIMDENFDEIISINSNSLPGYSAQARISINRQSATLIENKLFVLFNVDEEFYFYVYLPISKKFISLATDFRMNWFVDYVILNCNDEVYYVGDTSLLKYCFHLNRWITFQKTQDSKSWFASDGKILYKISFQRSEKQFFTGDLVTMFYDFKQKTWNRLPDVHIQPSLRLGERIEWNDFPIKLNVIKNDFCVLFKSNTFFFHWKTQTWSSIDNLYENFLTFTGRDENILYISAENEVQLYSPFQKKWIFDQKLDNFSCIFAIHTIMK